MCFGTSGSARREARGRGASLKSFQRRNENIRGSNYKDRTSRRKPSRCILSHPMSILVNKNTRVITQGITGSAGAFHTKGCLDYGTKMVGGVTPGKGGQKDPNNLPIFDTVEHAIKETAADATMIFVPPPFAADAIMEAADAGIKTIVAITEGIPVLDMVKAKAFLKDKPGILIGPNCPGIITPGECKIG